MRHLLLLCVISACWAEPEPDPEPEPQRNSSGFANFAFIDEEGEKLRKQYVQAHAAHHRAEIEEPGKAWVHERQVEQIEVAMEKSKEVERMRREGASVISFVCEPGRECRCVRSSPGYQYE